MLILEHQKGALKGQRLEIETGEDVVIGRGDVASLQIPDPTISRKHCRIRWEDGVPCIEDMGSRNGTFLNGKEIDRETLKSGDTIQLAQDVILRVRFGTGIPMEGGSIIRYNSPDDIFTPRREEEPLRDLNTLYKVGNIINAEQDLYSVLHKIAQTVLDVVKPDRVEIFLTDNGKLQSAALMTNKKTKYGRIHASRTILHRSISEGLSIITNDALTDSRFSSGSIIQGRIRSVMCAPLESTKTIVGAIYVDTLDRKDAFTERDLALLSALGKQAGVAVERAQLFEKLQQFLLDAVRTLVAAVEAKDHYTRGHSERVTLYALAIAEIMEFPPNKLTEIRIAGLLHDIGKIGVPEKILNKPGKLTPAEFEKIKLHPTLGARIVQNIKGTDHIVNIILHHHERFDGKGYPDGLKGNKIPLPARIIAIADSYDAMTSERPYRMPMSTEDAFAEILRNNGTQFDPDVVRAFEKGLDEGRIVRNPSIIQRYI